MKHTGHQQLDGQQHHQGTDHQHDQLFGHEYQQHHLHDQELRSAWTGLIEGYAWSHWATLEFAPHMQVKDPSTAFDHLQAYADSLTRETLGPVPWLAVAERHADDTIHLHVFFRGTSGIPLPRLKKRWERRNGSCKIYVYDPSQNAAGYSVKRLTADRSELMMSDGFDRAMRRLDSRQSVD